MLRILTKDEEQRTRFWIPIISRPKKESGKVRLITDLRLLSACHQVPKHKAETWQHVLQVTNDPKLKWGLTLDLKSYYHHL